MTETIFYLRWDGRCVPGVSDPVDAQAVSKWCNTPAVVDAAEPPPSSPFGLGTATTSASPGAGVALALPMADVVLMSVDKVFAPIQEFCSIRIKVMNIALAGCMVMQIYRSDGTLVYAERIPQKRLWKLAADADFEYKMWAPLLAKKDGDAALVEATKKADREALSWANPLHSPYTVKLFITGTVCAAAESAAEIGLTVAGAGGAIRAHSQMAPLYTPITPPEINADQTSVRYAAVELDQPGWDVVFRGMTGRANWDDPGSNDDVGRMWLQSRLNDLGFWAGPVDGSDSEDLKKAIRRFRMAHPDLSGWSAGTKPYEERMYSDPAEEAAQPKPEMVFTVGSAYNGTLKTVDGPVRAALASPDTRKLLRKPVMNSNERFVASGNATKLYLDNHRYFVGEFTEFSAADAPNEKFLRDSEFLTRPVVPLLARVFLQGKSFGKFNIPLAAGDLKIRWKWTDAAEQDAGMMLTVLLPENRTSEPSRTKDYVRKAQADAKARGGSYNGVRIADGGILSGVDATDAAAAFARLHPVAGYTPSATGVLVHMGARTAPHQDFEGQSLIYLRPSTVAGDNYQVFATFDPADHANEDNVRRLHGEQLRSILKPLEAKSERIALWRRIQLSAYVYWGERFAPRSVSSEMNAVIREFDPCFIELVKDELKVYRIDDVMNSAAFDDFINITAGDAPDRQDFKTLAGKFNSGKIWGHDPDDYPATPSFQDAVNRLANLAKVQNDIRGGSCSEAAKIAASMAEQWSGSSNAEVKNAGDHITAQLSPFIEASGTPERPGDPKDWKLKAGVSGRDDSRTVAAYAGGGTLTGLQMEELLLLAPLRAELRAYAAGKPARPVWLSLVRKFTISAGQRMPSALENAYLKYFDEQVGKIRPAADYSDAVPKQERGYLLSLRWWVISRRVQPLIENGKMRLAEAVDYHARRKLASERLRTDGLLLLDYRLYDPIPADGEDRLLDGAAFGGLNGVVMLDQGLKSPFHSLAAHEAGHCMFLQHFKNAPSPVLVNHDTADDNCMMSYPYLVREREFQAAEQKAVARVRFHYDDSSQLSLKPHYGYDVFKPHFCGKCNLQLRGWHLHGGSALPAASPPLAPPPEKPRLVRLIPSTQDDSGRASASMRTIGISYYPALKAGSQTAPHNSFRVASLADLHRGFGFEENASKDPGLFRVEVIDPNVILDRVKVTLEARMPQYSGARVSGWTDFAGGERDKRALVDIECQPIPGDPHCYRSRFIKLVVDEADYAALYSTKQGLLVTDMADGMGTANDAMEILDQKVKVTYDPDRN